MAEQQDNQKFSYPSEIVKLPSKGLVYSLDNPLSSGEVEMKYMTAKEEDILTNINYIKQNTVIDKLLQSLIISKINIDDLITEDKDALLIAARVLGYGKDYTFKFTNAEHNIEEDVTVDLSLLSEKEFDTTLLLQPNTNKFEYTFSQSKNKITFKLLTGNDEKKINKELEGYKRISPAANPEITTRLKYIILSINDNEDPKAVREFVDNYLLAKESREFRSYYKTISPGVDMKFDYISDNYTQEGVEIPMTVNFLWPEL